MKRLYRGFLLFLLLATCGIQSAAAASVSVHLNGRPLSFDAAPYIENGRVLVPLRGVLEALDYSVYWQAHTHSVLAMKENIRITLPIDSKTVQVNQESVQIDVPATLKNGRTYVPLRALGEALECDITWINTTKTVEITQRIDPSEYKAWYEVDKQGRLVVNTNINSNRTPIRS